MYYHILACIWKSFLPILQEVCDTGSYNVVVLCPWIILNWIIKFICGHSGQQITNCSVLRPFWKSFHNHNYNRPNQHFVKSTNYQNLKVLFLDLVCRVCWKFYILVILYRFGGIVINKKVLKQSCKDLFILEELPIIWLIIRFDNKLLHRSQWGISCN